MRFLKRFWKKEEVHVPTVEEVKEKKDTEDKVLGLLKELRKDQTLWNLIVRLSSIEGKEIREIMVQRDRVVSVPYTATIWEFIQKCIVSGHTKLPVSKDTMDEIIGVAFLKDVLKKYGLNNPNGESIQSVVKKPFFVPEVKHVLGLVKTFQERRITFAMVVDEFGCISGIITLNDIIEELFGEMLNYGEAEEKEYVSLPRGSFEVLARMSLDELREETGLELPKQEQLETLSGFLLYNLGRIPKVGESVETGGFKFDILHADARRIIKVRIEPLH